MRYGHADQPAAASAWCLAVLAVLAFATTTASARTQTVGTDVRLLRLGPNAVCGNAVPGHTLLCFDPSVEVPLGTGGATLRVTTSNVTLASGDTRVVLTTAGNVLINGATAGPAGTMTIAGTTVNRVDGIWNIQRETLLSPVGAIQDVCVVGTGVCGVRMVLSPNDPSIGVVAGGKVIIDDNISLPMVLGALSSDTIHVVSRWSIFSAQQHSQLVLPVDVPVDGTVTLTLREFTGSSRCGNAYYRQVCSAAVVQGLTVLIH